MTPTTYEDLNASLDERIGGLRKNYDTALESYFKTPQITPSQALIQGVMNILPMIIGGAIAKKKGALLGAKAGQVAGEGYKTNIATENKRKQENAGLEAKRINDELTNLIGQKNKTELAGISENYKQNRFETTESNKFARANATNATTLKAAQEMKMNPAEQDVWDLAKGARQTERRVSNVINLIDKMGNPEEGVPEALAQNAIAYYVEQGGERAQIQRDLKEMALAGKAILGPGQLTNQEREVLDSLVGGRWNVPLQTVKSIAIKTAQKQYETVNDTVDMANDSGFRMNVKRQNPRDQRLLNNNTSQNDKMVSEIQKLYPGSKIDSGATFKGKPAHAVLNSQGQPILVLDPTNGELLWSEEQ